MVGYGDGRSHGASHLGQGTLHEQTSTEQDGIAEWPFRGGHAVRISEVSISRPVFASMMILALVVFGLASYGTMGERFFRPGASRSVWAGVRPLSR